MNKITSEQFNWLRKQIWKKDSGKCVNGDYEMVSNPIMIKTLNKNYSEISDDDNMFLITWFNKMVQNEKDSFFSAQNAVLQLIATRQEDEATEIIVEKILNTENIYSTESDIKSEMWIYYDGIYIPNGATAIKKISRDFLGKAYTPQRANKVIEKIRADTFIKEKEFFSMERENVYEQPVKNGILNIKTLELTEFTPTKIFFNKLPVIYNKDAKCPMIEKFLNDILSTEDDKNIIYELLGLCLVREYLIEKSFMFLGNGRNGKTKLLGLFKNFLGVNNVSATPLQQLESNSSGVCELFGKLANISSDLSSSSLKDSSIFKQLTGRDLISAKRKFLTDLNFENYAKLIFACNELPRVYDLTDGFFMRWVLLEFPYKFLSESEIKKLDNKDNCKVANPEILEKIITDEELSGLLNEALNGFKILMKNKDFSKTKGSNSIKNFWIRKSNSFLAFTMDMVEEDYNGFVSKKELRQKFNQYCKFYKIRGCSDKEIKYNLENKFGVIDGRKEINGEFQHIWDGIKLKDFNNCQDYQGFQKSIGNSNIDIGQNMVVTLTVDDKSVKKQPKILNLSQKELFALGYSQKEIDEILNEVNNDTL